MQQLSLFDRPDLKAVGSNINPNKVINVASVPQRSPFRYPGGKTWLVPYIRTWLNNLPQKPLNFIEPFCGGGIVSLNVAFDGLADRITMVELDSQVAAVWATIIMAGEGAWLSERIVTFDLNSQNLEEVLNQPATTQKEKAFQTILKNRVNRGGILAPGAGRVKDGENGKGLKSRWYPETLKKRILDINGIRERLNFVEGDGIKFMGQTASHDEAVFFIDPPYTVKGKGKQAGSRLYTHFELEHEELFKVTGTVAGEFLMTYDDAEDVRELAKAYGFDTALVPMKNTHHEKMYELLISRNLDWYRRSC